MDYLARYVTTLLTKGTVYNSCGKEVYEVSPFDKLKRFLFLGTEKGTFYIDEKELSINNLECLEVLLADERNHNEILDIIEEYCEKAFKRDYLIYVLARLCSAKEYVDLRVAAYSLLNKVCTIPTHLFLFLEYYQTLYRKLNHSSGWNPLHKRYIEYWYLDKSEMELVYQVTKYKNRNGWTHRDVLRLSHIKPLNEDMNDIFWYIVHGTLIEPLTYPEGKGLEYIRAYDAVQRSTDKEFVISMIRQWGFVREHIPTQFQKDVDVMNELVNHMPMVALVRTINRITAVGVFDKYPETIDKVLDKLDFRKTHVHPLQFLISVKMYNQGHGDLGKLSWVPNNHISRALSSAFYQSFKSVKPTNKRFLLALDVSGSMTWNSVCNVSCLRASEVACAMAMVIKAREPLCEIMGFADTFKNLNIDPEVSLETNLSNVYKGSFGSTDLSLPMTWATENRKKYDVIIVITDNETNVNEVNPCDALREYRRISGLPVKLIVIALASNRFTIADPNDRNMLDIAGFDAGTPEVIREFVMS
jgi:60 kDa SS-A/Ro ribonucleoprotein